jgi:cytochrome b6-f complex iron-sulfur subunit
MREIARRDALRLAAGLGAASLGSAGCGGSPRSDRPSGSGDAGRSPEATTTGASRRELAALAAVPDGEAVDVSAAAGEPAYLIRSGDTIRALSATCTHARCTVAWQASSRQFRCPCHRGTYDSQGSVVSGPPPRALDELQIVVENGTAYLEP